MRGAGYALQCTIWLQNNWEPDCTTTGILSLAGRRCLRWQRATSCSECKPCHQTAICWCRQLCYWLSAYACNLVPCNQPTQARIPTCTNTCQSRVYNMKPTLCLWCAGAGVLVASTPDHLPPTLQTAQAPKHMSLPRLWDEAVTAPRVGCTRLIRLSHERQLCCAVQYTRLV